MSVGREPGIGLIVPGFTVNYFVAFGVEEIVRAISDKFAAITADFLALLAGVPFMALHESLLMFAAKGFADAEVDRPRFLAKRISGLLFVSERFVTDYSDYTAFVAPTTSARF